MDENKIQYADSLQGLRAEALKESVYQLSADSHPTGEGYKVIAREAAAATYVSSSERGD